MLQLIIIPLALSVTSTAFGIFFEHYVVVPHKEGKRASTWTIPYSTKFVIAQFAGIIAFELIFRTFFPRLEDYSGVIEKYLNDAGVTFAGVFYICLASAGLTYDSKSTLIIFLGCFITPVLVLNWWIFTYLSDVSGMLIGEHVTFTPISYCISLIWLYLGMGILTDSKLKMVMTILILFPIHALFLSTQTTGLNAWLMTGGLSGLASLAILANPEVK